VVIDRLQLAMQRRRLPFFYRQVAGGAVATLIAVASQLVDRDLTALKPFFNQIHFKVSDSSTINSIEKLLSAKNSTFNLIGTGLLLYAALQIVEGIGLWSLKRWGEYVAVVGTSAFVPLEVYEVVDKASWLKIVLLLVNVAAVVYLLLSKRLFGIRGGGKAYEATLHEASLLEVEESSEVPAT